jgi:hypothetical protein
MKDIISRRNKREFKIFDLFNEWGWYKNGFGYKHKYVYGDRYGNGYGEGYEGMYGYIYGKSRII